MYVQDIYCNNTFTVLSAEQETTLLSSGENMQVNTSWLWPLKFSNSLPLVLQSQILTKAMKQKTPGKLS